MQRTSESKQRIRQGTSVAIKRKWSNKKPCDNCGKRTLGNHKRENGQYLCRKCLEG
ncbi:hypothetical protein M0R04_08610 [Candidatus Dojkabacteria bacterium]|jgi:formylmethanofuran dehydrogenase subunit E|nr:hypothetical protein [Candidatus Dojkabacteria bacterium]